MVSGDEVASPQLGRHVIRVGAYSAAIYREWAVDHGVPALTVTRWALLLRRAAMQHDIGKAGVPADILNKRGRLTREEQRVMRSHCQYAALLCAGQHTPWARLGAEVALNHHERWDGSGYPGLDGSGRRANDGPAAGSGAPRSRSAPALSASPTSTTRCECRGPTSRRGTSSG